MVPKDVHIYIPRTYADVIFEDVIKLKVVKWGDYPGLCERPHYNHKGLYKGVVGGSEAKKPKQQWK